MDGDVHVVDVRALPVGRGGKCEGSGVYANDEGVTKSLVLIQEVLQVRIIDAA